jgi:hypothetical protein
MFLQGTFQVKRGKATGTIVFTALNAALNVSQQHTRECSKQVRNRRAAQTIIPIVA